VAVVVAAAAEDRFVFQLQAALVVAVAVVTAVARPLTAGFDQVDSLILQIPELTARPAHSASLLAVPATASVSRRAANAADS
jgi:hypothetical protein